LKYGVFFLEEARDWLHYTNGEIDRTFTALSCSGTLDQADGITIEREGMTNT
jgi:hypothetical protein